MKNSKLLFLAISGAALVVLSTVLYRDSRSLPDTAPEQTASPAHTAESDSSPNDPAPLPIRESVLRLTGQLGDGAPASRRAALRTLPPDLNPKELDAIYASILEHPQPETFPRRAWHALFSDTLNALVLQQNTPVADLPHRLLAIVKDAGRHRVLRDYALQQLLSFAEYRAGQSQRVGLLETTWQEISQTRDSFRGTYLLALSYQAGEPGWPAAAEVATKAWQVASADDARVLSRITALQVCGKLGHREALPLALQIATDSQAHMTLRTSAIATIGDLGSESERTSLASLAQHSPPRLQVAIQAALARINQKKGQA